MDFNLKAKQIFEQNKKAGWWDDMNRCIFQVLQLVNTEIAEATEGARKNLMDDHLPHRKMEEVELADALIRILDLGGRCGWEYADIITPESREEGLQLLKDNDISDGFLHLQLTSRVCNIADELSELDSPHYGANETITSCYSALIQGILIIGEYKGYDIISAMEEKLLYNQNRKDHKREVRAEDGGKKW